VLPATGVLFMSHRFGMNEFQTGLALALVGVCSMVVQAGLVRPMVKRFGEPRMLMVGIAFGCTGFLLYGLVPTMLLFFAVVPFMALKDFAGPSLQALMTSRVSPTEQGQLQGANSSLMSIAGIFGPVMFTQTFSFFIAPGGSANLPGAAFLLAGLMMMLALLIAWKTVRVPS
jgi:MFS transporter, DHA1 family, tetracycline resistance protein